MTEALNNAFPGVVGDEGIDPETLRSAGRTAGIIGLVMSRALPLFRVVQLRLDRINLVMRETLTGVRVIRAFVRVDHEERRFDGANLELTHFIAQRIEVVSFDIE